MRLQAAGSAKIGAILLQRQSITGPSDETDVALAAFAQWDILGFLRSRGIFGVPAAGSCIETPAEDSGVSVSAQPLDAGDQLTLQWRGGTRTLAKNTDGTYGGVVGGRGGLAAFLVPNTYMIDNGAGGADVGPFTVSLRTPTPVTWTNKQAQLGLLSQTTRWTGGDPDGYVLVAATLTNSTGQFRQVCTAPASAGMFVLASPDYDGGLLEGRPYGHCLSRWIW